MGAVRVLGGRYRMQRLLGRGGWPQWSGVDPQMGRRVDIKVLDPKGAGRTTPSARFDRQVRAKAAVNDPHIGDRVRHR